MSLFPLGLLSQGGGGGAAGAFELIETINGTGSSSSITFSSIPSTYKHLRVRFAAVMTSANQNTLRMRFNGDTGSNYSYHGMIGYSSSPYAAPTGTSTAFMNISPGYVGLQNYPYVGIIDVLNYIDTNTYKTAKTLSGTMMLNNNSYELQLMSGNWRSTSAVTSLTLLDSGGTNFSTATRFSLYGIKG
jgi:hypothetical protein